MNIIVWYWRRTLKYLLYIAVLNSISVPFVRANIWGDIENFFVNPCSFMCPDISETWNGRLYEEENYCNCPPYLKDIGRNSCVKQFPFPNAGWVNNICAENTSSNNYFNPVIMVREQYCDGFFCYGDLSKTLSWNGECVVWPGGLLPVNRTCARIATATDTTNDPGYTRGVALNNEGVAISDCAWYDSQNPSDCANNNWFKNQPKLCAYDDPGIVTFDFRDPADISWVSQPFHQSDAVDPVAQIMILAIKASISFGQIAPSTIAAVLPDVGIFIAYKMILDLIQTLELLLGDGIITILEQFGLNRIVGKSYGCVNIPFGPLPPPYPRILSEGYTALQAQQICPTYPNGDVVQSPVDSNEEVAKYGINVVSSIGCAFSQTPNTAINNSIRIALSTITPTCSTYQEINNSQTSINYTSASCVDISYQNSLSTLHTTFYDLLPRCTSANQANCVNADRVLCKDVTCDGKFRVIYGTSYSDGTFGQNNFYDATLPDCPSVSNSSCQFIWGIDFAMYKDMVIDFTDPKFANIGTSDLVVEDVLKDHTGAQYTVQAKIAQVNTNTQTPQQICAYYLNNSLTPATTTNLGCFDRPLNPSFTALDCISTGLCTSTYFNPSIVVSASIGGKTLSKPLTVPIFNNTTNTVTTTGATVNLLGSNVTAYVTDATLVKQPFTGPQALSSNSIFGYYENGETPVTNPNAVYIEGLEYKNGGYIRGGTEICLNSSSNACSTDVTQCVLTKYSNSIGVPCTQFNNIGPTYGLSGFRFCTAGNTVCQNLTRTISYPHNGSSVNVQIYACNDGSSCYFHNNDPFNDPKEPLCVISEYNADSYVDTINNNGTTQIIAGGSTSLNACPASSSNCTAYYNNLNNSSMVNGYCSISSQVTSYANSLSSTYPGLTQCTTNSTGACTCPGTTTNCAYVTTSTPSSTSSYNLTINQCLDPTGASLGYCYIPSGVYNKDVCVVRDKNDLENDLCVDVPQIACPTTTDSTNATWPYTAIGEMSTGTCLSGYTSNGAALERYCLVDYYNQTTMLGAASASCSPIPQNCPAYTDQYNSIPTTPSGGSATYQCCCRSISTNNLSCSNRTIECVNGSWNNIGCFCTMN
jgi:hypothetical protein